MKEKKFLVYAGMILALACMLVLAGCPKQPDDDDEPDDRLVGYWSNDPDGTTYTGNNAGRIKDFRINSDFSFETEINVPFLSIVPTMGVDPAAGMLALDGGIDAYIWTISGKLEIVEDNIYKMRISDSTGQNFDLTAPPAMTLEPNIVYGYNNISVKLTVIDAGHFSFASATNDSQVNEFFGGDYYTDSTP
jgi:hypothetical protein